MGRPPPQRCRLLRTSVPCPDRIRGGNSIAESILIKATENCPIGASMIKSQRGGTDHLKRCRLHRDCERLVKRERNVRLRSIWVGAFIPVAVAALLACYQACGSSAAPLGQFQPLTNAHIQEELRRIHQQAASLPQRVEAVSELFLGAPYKHGAAGRRPQRRLRP